MTWGVKGERMQRVGRCQRPQGGNKLRKVMLLAAMLAMVLATAVPALATTMASPSATPSATVVVKKSVTATAASAQYAQYKTVGALPPTGGPGLPSGALALGAGALLVGSGLVARRIVR